MGRGIELCVGTSKSAAALWFEHIPESPDTWKYFQVILAQGCAGSFVALCQLDLSFGEQTLLPCVVDLGQECWQGTVCAEVEWNAGCLQWNITNKTFSTHFKMLTFCWEGRLLGIWDKVGFWSFENSFFVLYCQASEKRKTLVCLCWAAVILCRSGIRGIKVQVFHENTILKHCQGKLKHKELLLHFIIPSNLK